MHTHLVAVGPSKVGGLLLRGVSKLEQLFPRILLSDVSLLPCQLVLHHKLCEVVGGRDTPAYTRPCEWCFWTFAALRVFASLLCQLALSCVLLSVHGQRMRVVDLSDLCEYSVCVCVL